MPTSYTAAVEDGEITTLEDYIRRCARQFGAFFHQREDSLGEEPKYPDLDILYEEKSLKAKREELKHWQDMTAEEIRKIVIDIRQRSYEQNKEILAKYALQNKRYDDMLEKVRAWEPPTEDHQNLKNFALDQLHISRTKDDFIDRYYRQPIAEYETTEPEPIDPEAVRQERIADCERDISRYQERIEEMKQKHQENIKWIDQLFNSLKEENNEE